jgi:hypothetical protein
MKHRSSQERARILCTNNISLIQRQTRHSFSLDSYATSCIRERNYTKFRFEREFLFLRENMTSCSFWFCSVFFQSPRDCKEEWKWFPFNFLFFVSIIISVRVSSFPSSFPSPLILSLDSGLSHLFILWHQKLHTSFLSSDLTDKEREHSKHFRLNITKRQESFMLLPEQMQLHCRTKFAESRDALILGGFWFLIYPIYFFLIAIKTLWFSFKNRASHSFLVLTPHWDDLCHARLEFLKILSYQVTFHFWTLAIFSQIFHF